LSRRLGEHEEVATHEEGATRRKRCSSSDFTQPRPWLRKRTTQQHRQRNLLSRTWWWAVADLSAILAQVTQTWWNFVRTQSRIHHASGPV